MVDSQGATAHRIKYDVLQDNQIQFPNQVLRLALWFAIVTVNYLHFRDGIQQK